MADLLDVFRNGAGAYDALMAGEADGLKRQATLADLTTKRLANEQSAAMNPLLQSQQRLNNQTLDAQLPGHVGDSMTKFAGGQVAAAGVPDKIRTQASDAQGKLADNAAAEIARFGKTLSMISSQTAGMAPLARSIFIGNQIMQVAPNLPDDQVQTMMQLSPEQLTEVGKRISLADPKHQQEIDKQGMVEKGLNDRSAATNQTQKEVAEIYASARKKAAENFWVSFRSLKGAKNQHAALIAEATRIKDADPDQANQYLAMADALRPQAEAEIASMKPGQLDTPAMTGLPATQGPSIAPRQAAPAQAAPQVQSLGDLKRLYPGRSDDELRAAYKRKYGKELN